MPLRVGPLLVLVGLALCLFGPGGVRCLAHPGNLASAIAKVQPGGDFQVRLRFDLLAYALDALPNHISDTELNALLDGPPADLDRSLDRARERFRQSFQAISTGVPVAAVIDSVEFPDAAAVRESVRDLRTRLPLMGTVTVTGHMPPGTDTIAFRFDEGLGPVVLTTESPYREPISEPVEAGAFSAPQRLPTAESVARAAAELQPRATPQPAATASAPAPRKTPRPVTTPAPARRVVSKTPLPSPKTAQSISAPSPTASAAPTSAAPSPAAPASPTPAPTPTPALSPSPTPPPVPSPAPETAPVMAERAAVPQDASHEPPAVVRWLTHVSLYLRMGYLHILPEGIDHILFILGLFLLSVRTKPLLQQITAFTVAHSLTLALSLLGWVRLPPAVVEPIIAASIAYVAIENLATTDVKPWRVTLIFGFGLIHGLGFARALQEMGLQQRDLLTALIGFNVGVELGQLSVVAAALVLVGRFRDHPQYRKFVVLPGSLAIALAAVYWTIERVLS